MFITQHGIIDSVQNGALVDYYKLNFSSVSTADSDRVSFQTGMPTGTRTLNFKITPLVNINSGSPIYNIFSYYDNNNISVSTNRIDIGFFSGVLQFQRRIAGTAFNVVSNSNSWNLGQTYDISLRMDASSGMSMLVDNVLQSSTNASTGAFNTVNGNFFMGGNVVSNIRYIPASISNVQFWDVSRSVAQNATDKDTYYSASEPNLIDAFNLEEGSGATINGVNGNTGTIATNNAGGITHINTNIWELI